MPRPLFSIVTAVHDAELRLPDFIASVEAQRFDLDRIEVVAVDDASTDASPALLAAWAARRPGMVTVLAQTVRDRAAALNRGLGHAAGEWVAFGDPEGMLHPDCLATAARATRDEPDLELLAGRLVPIDEPRPAGAAGDGRDRPRRIVRRVCLDDDPGRFAAIAGAGLYRLDRIRSGGLAWDARVRPTFGAEHFAAGYLLSLPEPDVGLLRDATFLHRAPAGGEAARRPGLADPSRYTDVLEFGCLDLMRRATAAWGAAPAWLQHVLIRELSGYLAQDERSATDIRMSPATLEQFHELFGRILAQLDPSVVRSHTLRRLKPVWVDILAHAHRGRDWHSTAAARTKVDPAMGLQRITYRYLGRVPREEVLLDGVPADPPFAKTMAHLYYRRPLIHERIVWLPVAGAIELRLDGHPLEIADAEPVGPAETPAVPAAAGSHGPPGRRPRRLRSRVAEAIAALGGRWQAWLATDAPRFAARTAPYRSRYRRAWVVMDRIHDADDNGERLFEYLAAERPDINAWFVLERGTPGWQRMRAAGVRRLVAHGSFGWKMLMLNCAWLVSSHADRAIAEPPEIVRITGRPTWRYAFLQHGVTQNDLSRWLNQRDLDLFATSTRAETDSVVGDETAYRFTAKETRLTGMPRFDRLLEKGRTVEPEQRDLLIVAPTWRSWLVAAPAQAQQRREVGEAFWGSEYLRCWDAVVRSPDIAAAAARRDLRVVFMPHPNLQPVLARMDLPPHVEPLTFADSDVQGIYARCALLVTDYSSVAFDVACLGRPVVYFQFDAEAMLGGSHTGRQGYFDYARDGFGPLTTDPEGAVAAIVAAIEGGPQPTAEYQARIDRTFVDLDGRACARVVAAIEELDRPYAPPGRSGPPAAG